jgi:putative transposase
MKLQKTVKARIFGLTKIKEALLREEYDNFQAALRGFDVSLYSATRQQAIGLLRKIRKQNGKGLKLKKEYPLILRRDVFNVRETETKLARFWVKIPVHHIKGGIKVPIQLPKNQEELLSLSIREGKLFGKGDHWSLHITVMKEVQLRSEPPSTILAVDLGERYIATSVVYANGVMRNPRFHGKQVRGIRRHYAWLRKRLGERKLLHVIRRVGHTERKQVNAILHKTSRDIVDEAKRLKATIVLGDLKGIRKGTRGRRMNRIVSNMPYYRLTQMIIYKEHWEGIQVYKVGERNTSKTCHKCGNIGGRFSQARFKCSNCGLDYFNADLNGAINIAERFSSYIGENGAALDTALDSGDVKLC